jgi:pimeloyl-ACP methyl ester carboxylesterase
MERLELETDLRRALGLGQLRLYYQPIVALETCEVACELSGEGSPELVLIHGLGASTVLWSDVQPALEDGHGVISYDLRGAGRTRQLEPRELSLATWADDLRALLAALEVETPVLVAHSLGAAVALKYALAFPDDLAGLVLMGADPDLANLAPRMEKAAELIERVGLNGWLSEHWAKNPPFAAASLARDPRLLDRYRAMLLANDPRDYVQSCRAIATAESLGGRLGDVTQPALVIVGAEDDRTLPEHGRRLAKRLPDARVVELADVGHTMPFEAPDEVAAAVRGFVAELAA